MSTINNFRAIETTAYELADTPLADEVKNEISVVSTDTVEKEFSELLTRIPDPVLRELIDAAVGKIAFTYERLGFVNGVVTDRVILNIS